MRVPIYFVICMGYAYNPPIYHVILRYKLKTFYRTCEFLFCFNIFRNTFHRQVI